VLNPSPLKLCYSTISTRGAGGSFVFINFAESALRGLLMRVVVLAVFLALPAWSQTMHGLGFSSKTCIDLDGDGYGTGPLASLVTTASTKVSPGSQTVTLDAVAGLTAGQRVRYDSGANLEFVTLTAVSGNSITGYFLGAHAAGVTVSAGTKGDGSLFFPGYPHDDPGCLGLDADDRDATVQTAAQGTTKYGSLTAFLAKLGRDWQTLEADSAADLNGNAGQAAAAAALLIKPAHIYYVAPASASSGCTGTPAQCAGQSYPAHNCTSINSPCLTIGDLLSAGYRNTGLGGDLIIARDGWNNNSLNVTMWSGSSSRYNGLWSYPGEHAVLTTKVSLGPPSSCGGTPSQTNYVWVDGMRVKSTSVQVGGSIVGGSCPSSSGQNHDVIVSHTNGTESDSGGLAPMTGFNHIDNWTIAYNVLHDDNCPSSCNTPHGFYMGGNEGPSSNTTIRRNLIFRNSWNGLHWNGQATGFFIDQNVSYDNGITGLDFEMGLAHSYIRANQSFNNAKQMVFYDYPGNCPGQIGYDSSGPSICPYDESYNLIENNTFFTTGNADGLVIPGSNPDAGCPSGINYCAQPTIQISNATNPLVGNMGNNTFRNNVIVSYGLNDAKPPIAYGDPTSNGTCGSACRGWAGTSTFDHNLFWQSDRRGGLSVLLMGPNKYTCGNAGSVTTAFTNCNVADPQFVAEAISRWNVESYFDFRLQSASPALGAGSITGIPAYDAVGNAYATKPSIGAIDQAVASSPNPTPAPPIVSITAPLPGANVSGTVSASAMATASGTLSIGSVQFQVDGINLGSPVTTGPAYMTSWNTTGYANGSHTLTASATDSGGNTGGASVTVIVNNTGVAPPVISAVTAGSISSSGATITWTTTIPSSSQVLYGATPGYGQATTLQSLATSHSIALSGLSASTVYYYEVLSRDSLGNLATSGGYTLSTSAATPSGVGWTDLGPATKLQSVCPPNDFNGIKYNFADNCPHVTAAWSGAVADTTRNRLIIWGGGHVDYSGNEVYSLNLGSATPTITRLTNPSDFTKNTGCPDANMMDGTPVSRHTYGGIVYLPAQNKMYSFGGGPAPCGNWSGATYTLDLSQTPPTWSKMDPVNGFSMLGGYFAANAICGYDSNTATVICETTGTFFRYDPATNTSTKLSTGSTIPLNAYGVIDPKRKLFIFMGPPYQSTAPTVYAVDISKGSTFQSENWSSQVTGCDVLASTNYPGLVYDPVLDRIVGWPNSGNTVYIFDEDTKTCTTQTFANGPTNSASSTDGTFGRFQYFPGLNKYALVTTTSLDAFTLNLSATLTPSACDLNGDGVVNNTDVQLAIAQAIGTSSCTNSSLQQNGQCNVIDVQRVVNASLGGSCKLGP